MNKRVLIIGEYSAVGLAFLRGFNDYDNSIIVDHITEGDSYKGLTKNKFLAKSRIFSFLYLIFQGILYSTKKYDYGLWLSPFVFKGPVLVIKIMNYLLTRACKKNIVYNCTSDSVYWRNYNLNFNRKTLLGFLHDTDFIPHRNSKKAYYLYNLAFIKKMDHVFCASEEYQYPYNDICKSKILRYPIMTNNLDSELEIKKIKHYHGISRPGFKGTKYILQLLKNNGIFPYLTKKITYKEFVENLKKTIVYYDQFHSIFPGIASLLSLYYCPYVYSGIDRNLISNKTYSLECPIIDLQDKFRVVDLNKGSDELYKSQLYANRSFLKKYHSPKVIVNLMFKYIHENN